MKRVVFLVIIILLFSLGFWGGIKKTPLQSVPEKIIAKNFYDDIPADLILIPVDFSQLEGFDDDQISNALPALEKSCIVLEKRYIQWQTFCKKLKETPFFDDHQLRSFLKREMQPFSVNHKMSGVFTGYYEPEIEGSLVKTQEYDVPVYALPDDIFRINLGDFNPKYKGEIIFGRLENKDVKPYLTRREIEDPETTMPAEIIAWVKEPAELFVLQIQGSGVLKLPDGNKIGIGYAGNNGHPFTGIGSIMARKGLLKKGVYTMAEIKKWLIAHPKEAKELMQENDRYIFFKKMEKTGAVGSLGVPLTAGRSLAVDPSYIPLGSFLWLQTKSPDGTSLNRLMTAQDTGSAIKGPVRGDFFWGNGEKALEMAGRMKSYGSYFMLLPKEKNQSLSYAH